MKNTHSNTPPIIHKTHDIELHANHQQQYRSAYLGAWQLPKPPEANQALNVPARMSSRRKGRELQYLPLRSSVRVPRIRRRNRVFKTLKSPRFKSTIPRTCSMRRSVGVPERSVLAPSKAAGPRRESPRPCVSRRSPGTLRTRNGPLRERTRTMCRPAHQGACPHGPWRRNTLLRPSVRARLCAHSPPSPSTRVRTGVPPHPRPRLHSAVRPSCSARSSLRLQIVRLPMNLDRCWRTTEGRVVLRVEGPP